LVKYSFQWGRNPTLGAGESHARNPDLSDKSPVVRLAFCFYRHHWPGRIYQESRWLLMAKTGTLARDLSNPKGF